MIAIKCKCGSAFSAINSNYIDAEWKLQEMYYLAQGCTVENQESVTFSKCECDHRKSLKHEYEDLISEIIGHVNGDAESNGDNDKDEEDCHCKDIDLSLLVDEQKFEVFNSNFNKIPLDKLETFINTL